jgi:tetratricopeptide (TPR) repeat protein
MPPGPTDQLSLASSEAFARLFRPFASAPRPTRSVKPLACRASSLEKYEIAAQQLLDRIAHNPQTDASRMLLASCYGHLGRAEDARAIWAELLKINPGFSMRQRERVLPYKNPHDFQRIVEGLAKASLP